MRKLTLEAIAVMEGLIENIGVLKEVVVLGSQQIPPSTSSETLPNEERGQIETVRKADHSQ